MLILLFYYILLQDCSALAPKAVTKHSFFFKTVTLIVFVIYFFINVVINLLNNLNLTNCFTSTFNAVYVARYFYRKRIEQAGVRTLFCLY